MKKYNILYVINQLCIGGAERQIVQLLTGIHRSRFRPFMICFEKGSEFTKDIDQLDVPILYAERKWR